MLFGKHMRHGIDVLVEHCSIMLGLVNSCSSGVDSIYTLEENGWTGLLVMDS